MQLVTTILPYAQIILSVILITAVLLQQSSSDMGGALGGNGGDSLHHSRRGFKKFLYYLSIVCGILFTLSAILTIIIKAKN